MAGVEAIDAALQGGVEDGTFPGAVLAVLPVLVPALAGAAQYTWFIGMAVALGVYTLASRSAR